MEPHSDMILQDCANAAIHPTHCLQNNIFLWKANNYKCYSTREDEHDQSARGWLCKNCASPRKFGEGLPCPLQCYGKSCMSYFKDDDKAEEFKLLSVCMQGV